MGRCTPGARKALWGRSGDCFRITQDPRAGEEGRRQRLDRGTLSLSPSRQLTASLPCNPPSPSPASWALPPLPSSSQSSGVSPQPMSPPQCALHEQAHFCAHAQRVSEHPRRPHAPRSVRLHPVTLLKPGGRAQLQHQTEPVVCNRRGSRPQGREAEPAKRASHQSPCPPNPWTHREAARRED